MMKRMLSTTACRALVSGVLAAGLFTGCLSAKPQIKTVPTPPPVTLKSPPAPLVPAPAAPVKPAPVVAAPVTARAQADRFPAVNIPGKVHVPAAPKPLPKPAIQAPGVPPAPAVGAEARPDAAPGNGSASTAAVAGGTTSSSIYRLRTGDQVVIALKGAYNASIEDVVDESGMINLIFLGDMKIDGLTASEVEKKVRDAYIDGGIFKQIYVTAFIPTRHYTIGGEVKNPGSAPINGRITLLQAIPAAGGFTEFPDKKRLKITRKGKQITVNYLDVQSNPEKDIEIEPDDLITVPRDTGIPFLNN